MLHLHAKHRHCAIRKQLAVLICDLHAHDGDRPATVYDAAISIDHPAGLLHAVAMMLEYSLGRPELATVVRSAVQQAFHEGLTTQELCLPGQRTVTASVFGDRVAEILMGKC